MISMKILCIILIFSIFVNILLYISYKYSVYIRILGKRGAMPEILYLYPLLIKQGNFIYNRMQSLSTMNVMHASITRVLREVIIIKIKYCRLSRDLTLAGGCRIV